MVEVVSSYSGSSLDCARIAVHVLCVHHRARPATGSVATEVIQSLGVD